jgi:CDP-4-dehydro-6-deoxyglucose reductase
MSVQPWRICKIIRIQKEAPETLRFWFQAVELDRFDFKPGQFVTLDLPIHEKPNKRWRSYSISSWPDNSNIFELIIVRNESGPGTNFLFGDATIGKEIPFRGPQGVFTLPECIDKDLFLICTGTGLAPFRSMLHHILFNNIPHKDIYLIFGTRNRESLLYYEELRTLSTKYPEFHYIPVLSREQWEGQTGYVHDAYTTLLSKKQPADFFLCGWKNMINDAKQRIQEMGYDKKSIHQEIYG